MEPNVAYSGVAKSGTAPHPTEPSQRGLGKETRNIFTIVDGDLSTLLECKVIVLGSELRCLVGTSDVAPLRTTWYLVGVRENRPGFAHHYLSLVLISQLEHMR